MSDKARALKVTSPIVKNSYAAAVKKGILTNPNDAKLARLAPPGTDLRTAQDNAGKASKVLFRTNSLSTEPRSVQNVFEPSRNSTVISSKIVSTLKGMPSVSFEEGQAKPESTVKFNELVTVLFIDPEGHSLSTPSLYPTEQATKAKLEGLAKDVANCLVRDVTSEADLENIRNILDEMIKENPNTVNRSLRVAQMTGTDICTVQFTQPNIAFLNRYYYIYDETNNIKFSYLDYAVTLAIEKFTQNYTSFTGQMKRSLLALYNSIMEYLKGSRGGRKTRRSKQSKKSKKRKLSKRRTSKRRTLKKR
jgi:hypothetical protein